MLGCGGDQRMTETVYGCVKEKEKKERGEKRRNNVKMASGLSAGVWLADAEDRKLLFLLMGGCTGV